MFGKKLFATKTRFSREFSPYFEGRARRYSFKIKCTWSIVKIFLEKKTTNNYDLVRFN
jgi:hypothetical protein